MLAATMTLLMLFLDEIVFGFKKCSISINFTLFIYCCILGSFRKERQTHFKETKTPKNKNNKNKTLTFISFLHRSQKKKKKREMTLTN